MRLIIDIPEETYKGIMLGKWDHTGLSFYVKQGTPLPKHGRLIDADEMLRRLECWNTEDKWDVAHYNFTQTRILEAPIIVGADKEAET